MTRTLENLLHHCYYFLEAYFFVFGASLVYYR